MSKQGIKKQVTDFLTYAQNTNSFALDGQSQGYFGNTDNEYNAITGAMPAILPMNIATIGRDNERIEFTLLINPETWNQGKTNSNQSLYTRAGWSVQLWGPNQDTISSTGKTAAMMIYPTGLEDFTRSMSFSYLNFMSLVSTFRTNGYEFSDIIRVNSATRVINKVRNVQIMYDNNVFMGHFNNFTIDEVAETPYIFNYTFEFIVSSLTGNDAEIRGHYQPLPPRKTDEETGTGADPFMVSLVDDAYEDIEDKNVSYPTTPPRPTDDRTTEKLWIRVTGLPWSDALQYATDGSVQQNMELRKNLYSKTWDPNSHQFV